MQSAGGQGMEPAMLSCHPESRSAGEIAALRDTSEKTKKDDKTTRRGKLKVRIHVGDLRNALNEMEQTLSGLKRKYEANNIGEQRCLKRSPKSILKSEPIKGEIASIEVSDIDADEKDIVPEKDVGFMPHKSLSKLPVLDKTKFEEMPKVTTDILTKVVGLETLYGVLMEEHLGLQLALQDTARRLRAEERRARELEERRNPINLALAERIGQLQAEVEGLRRTVSELREENDHLEFRLLEMDEVPIRKTVYRSTESTRYDPTDIDDVSDSGVMSLPASDDEHTDFSVEAKSDGDVKGRLLSLSQNSAVGDRICIQQGLALLRHYEARIEALESTIAAMCHEATLSRSGPGPEELRTTGRIIATVLPFTERKDSCLQESGIFEEGEPDWASRGTQTELLQQGDLSTELEKLSKIREKMETASLQPQELPPGKQLAYYRSRVETLESRLELYQARPDEASRLLKARLEKEARLEAELGRLRERVAKLEEENRQLEEERCELEEAENDTRLRCQKLEFKLSALGEKKNCLKAQLEQLTHEMATREDERKHVTRMEAIVENYEKKNQELEEREMELRYRLQMLDNTMPALMMWNMWRMMATLQGQTPTVAVLPGGAAQGVLPQGTSATMAQTPGQPVSRSQGTREEELLVKLQALESRLNAENKLLQESRMAEEALRNKIHDLEVVLESKDTNILHILEREPEQDIHAFEKLSKMAKERVEMDRRIKDLELKEKMYQETLQQVDVMFTDMQGNYDRQLLEKDELLMSKESKLAETEHKLKQTSQLSEINLQMQEKLNQLEVEMKNLTETLKKREAEREALEKEERRLNTELHDCLQELDLLKTEIEGPMKGQLEVQRKKTLNLEKELERMQNERLEMQAEHRDEAILFEKRLGQMHKELLESDVTISELREEVQTLEVAIDDLKTLLRMEKSEKEEMKKAYEALIEDKDRMFEELKESMKSKPPEKSLMDEMQEIMPAKQKFDRVSTAIEDIPAEGDHPEPKGDFRRPLTSKSETRQVQEFCEQIKGAVNMTEHEIKSKTIQFITELMKDIVRGEPLLDTVSTKGILQEFYQKHDILNPECPEILKTTANSSSEKNVAKVNSIANAFKHSENCKSCRETLGALLGDLVKEIEVRCPSSNVLGNHQL